MKALDCLRKSALDCTIKRTPNVPSIAIPKPKYSDTTANGLTKCIVDFLQMNGCQAERISVEGRVIDSRKTYTDAIGRNRTIGTVKRIKSSSQVGSADISATIAGKSVKIEVKIGKDSQSSKQKQYQDQIESAGGSYLIAKNFQEFYDWYVLFEKG